MSARRAAMGDAFGTSADAQFFEHFQKKTIPETSEFVNHQFWNRFVLQLCRREPAIKHGALALSSLHQHWNFNGSSSYAVNQHAVSQYGKAVQHAQELVRRVQGNDNADRVDVQKILVACILFISFENIMGNYSTGALHLKNGLTILCRYFPNYLHRIECPAKPADEVSKLEVEIIDCFERLNFQAQTFSEARIDNDPMQVFRTNKPPPLPSAIVCMQQARRYITAFSSRLLNLGEIMCFSEANEQLDPAYTPKALFELAEEERTTTMADIRRWEVLFEEFLAESQHSASTEMSAHYLRLFHVLAVILGEVGCSMIEMSFDKHHDNFVRALGHAESVQRLALQDSTTGAASLRRGFSLDIGMCCCIFVIAQKCRDPRVRRRATALLDSLDRKDGVWEGVPAARLAECLVAVEERRAVELLGRKPGENPANVIKKAGDVPEEARVFAMQTEFKQSKQTIMVTLAIKTAQGIQHQQEVVLW